MSEIVTGNARLDADLTRINELLVQADLDEFIENNPANLLSITGSQVFSLMTLLSSEAFREGLYGESFAGGREQIRLLSQAVASRFGALLSSDEAQELARSSVEVTASSRDEIYDAVRGLGHSGFLLEIANGRLLPHVRANVFAAEKTRMATLTMEWDDCLFLCSSLISALSHYMKSFHNLMEQRLLAVNAEDLSHRTDVLSKNMRELDELIGAYHKLSKD